MKRVLTLFLVLICMLSLVACDKATGSGESVRDGDVSDILEIDKNVSSETEQTQQAIVESISGTISHIDEDKIYDLTEEEVKIIADIIENGTWNTEGTADCANDCKLIIDERTYYYHSECGTFNDKKNNQNLPVTAEEKENINAILAQYITLGLE
jgi:predicted small secreted protein